MKKPTFTTDYTESSGQSVVIVNGHKTGPILKGGDAVAVSMWLKQAWAELMRNAKVTPPPKDLEDQMAMEGC